MTNHDAESEHGSGSTGRTEDQVSTPSGDQSQWIRFSRRLPTGALLVITVALVLRLLAIPLAVLRINPYSQADAIGFARHAAAIGHGFTTGEVLVGTIFPAGSVISIYDLWALLLSPFWMLPGPSALYARIGMAALGALAAYNIYAIGRYYHSPLTGGIATLPVAIYPSFVLTQSSLLREAAVLAGITTATHLLIKSPSIFEDRQRTRGVLTVGALVFAVFLRYDNIPVYLLSLGVGVGVWYVRHHELNNKRRVLVGGVVGAIGIAGLAVAPRIVDYLAGIRRRRAQGRTAYLMKTVPTTISETVLFAPIGMAYFLFTPFPWMIANAMDLVVALEALGNVLFAVAGLWGLRVAWRRDPARTAALLVGFLAASVLYGIANANVGTVVRHRQMFVWVIYVFGAVGFTQWTGRWRLLEYW